MNMMKASGHGTARGWTKITRASVLHFNVCQSNLKHGACCFSFYCIFSGHYILWLVLREHIFNIFSVCVCVCSPFPVDIWSVGCIMGEMVKGSVIFQGTDRILHGSHCLCPTSSVFHSPSNLHLAQRNSFISAIFLSYSAPSTLVWHFLVMVSKHNLLNRTLYISSTTQVKDRNLESLVCFLPSSILLTCWVVFSDNCNSFNW